MTTEYRNDPERCPDCNRTGHVRTCDDCGVSAYLVDCGDYAQPRPIASGRVDGSDQAHDYCDDCAGARMTPTVTDDEIRTLSTEAGEHGDLEQVALCDAALAGDKAARRKCVAAINAARAQHDR